MKTTSKLDDNKVKVLSHAAYAISKFVNLVP